MAAICAGMWGSWAARNRRTGDVAELAGYAKFRAAMEKTEHVEAAGDADENETAADLPEEAAADPTRMPRTGSGSDPARAS
ncbi:hypothetical protein QIS99_23965 [Streptomyces sp. B-S-A8]|uniref:Uncharacterized protein n=1 Tax=Streptomyces solicavernae TaxID=3043614 RepID=A0ABT6RYK1_9ACTN|nr:hypothetical protein [Streptomyces sp. B-S-A8]MDI3389229.1 hypothetical protein [Streptomyces sp. B-S-A8]